MKNSIVIMLCICMANLIFCGVVYSQPGAEQFKQAFEKKMQQLKPEEVARRTIKYVEVIAGKPNGAYYPFKVTAYIHDYSAGYPANRYYGQTCVGKMDGWKFDMLKDDYGEWTVQGRMTVSGDDKKCTPNTAAGTEAIPLATLPGSIYQPGKTPAATPDHTKQASGLYIGEYAGYGSGGRLLIGMGFTLMQDGSYYNLDKKEGGTYTYDPQKATISFKNGFLNGQVGKNVKPTGFDLTNTIHCEPWRP